MERSFECPVCFEQYSDLIKPLLVPCGHTVCEPCLAQLIRNKILECPVCRFMHQHLSISALSPNYALIHSEKLQTTSSDLWEKLEGVHKQALTLKDQMNALNNSFERSKLSIAKIKADALRRHESFTEIINKIYTRLVNEANDLENQIEQAYKNTYEEIQKEYCQHQEISEALQTAYTNNQVLSPVMKLQIPLLKTQNFNTSLQSFVLGYRSHEIADKISKIFGRIEEINISKLEECVSNNRQGTQIIAHSSVSIGMQLDNIDQENVKISVQKVGKRKQKELQKEVLIGWIVEGKGGKWEKVPDWYEVQLIAATEQGEQEVFILHKKLNKFFVKFEEMKSYKLNRKGELKRGKRLRFVAAA